MIDMLLNLPLHPGSISNRPRRRLSTHRPNQTQHQQAKK
jgi:hypothetical protein